MHITDVLGDLRESFLGLRLRERVWGYRFKRKYAPLAAALQRFAECDCRKPQAQIKREILLCKRFWKCYPWHYFLYDFYRQDHQVTDEMLLNYVPEFFYYEVFLPHHNSRKLNVLLNDKGLIEEAFSALGIPQPRTLCKIIGGRLHSRNLLPISPDQLFTEISASASSKLVLKPMDGQGGAGVIVFHRSGDGVYQSRNGQTLDSDFLGSVSRQRNWILQIGLNQIQALADIYPHSVNTLRITSENLQGTTRVMTAELRTGRNGKEVDNASQLGVETSVHVATGQLAQYGWSNSGERFDKHPDTGFAFHGFRIPGWDDIKSAVEVFAMKCPRFVYLGWDIALTDNGLVVIEVTPVFGIDGQNLFDGLRNAFRIEDPAYFWTHRGKR